MRLLGGGYHQMDIARKLGITRMTLNRDMHYINEMTSKGLMAWQRRPSQPCILTA